MSRQLSLPDGAILAWPEHLSIDLVHTGPTIGRVRFDDTDRYHPAIVSGLEQALVDRVRTAPRAGGHTRIEEFDAWDMPEAELMRLRAVKLCRALMNTESIALASADVLIARTGQHVPAHQPDGAVAALTYVLAGSGPFAFQHGSLGEYRFAAPDDTRAGDCFAAPASMILTVPPVPSDEPLILVSFGFRRLP